MTWELLSFVASLAWVSNPLQASLLARWFFSEPGGPALALCFCPQFLQQTVTTVSDSSWTCRLTLEMCRQLSSYNGSPVEKVSCRGSVGRVGGGEGLLQCRPLWMLEPLLFVHTELPVQMCRNSLGRLRKQRSGAEGASGPSGNCQIPGGG